jgi:hypothetical protein
MKIGRNDLCPCGSGLKYKKCCAGKQEPCGQSAGMSDVMDEVKELLKGQSFASLEEANLFIGRHMQQRNQLPGDDFHGLSSEQMHRFLYFPFETPQLVTFPEVLDVSPEAPILTLFNLLVNAIGDQGLKPTSTGNLPRNLCREAALAFLGEEGYREKTRYGGINSEPDFFDLHVTRLVAELAGLFRKYKGKFILSRDCRKLLAEHGNAGIYPRLFRAFASNYNWAYRDGFQELPLVQQSFLFTMFLLRKFGDEWRPNVFYEDRFLRAFPKILDEVEPVIYITPEKRVCTCYSWRCLEGFAGFMGLVEIEKGSKYLSDMGFRLKKRPLLDAVVQFNL